MGANRFIRIISWVVAIIASCGIVYLVFNFGYYASGLALHKYEEKVRSETPIPTKFADPNSP